MFRTALFSALLLVSAGPALSQDLFRKHIDNGLNQVESWFGKDTVEHDVRSLGDFIALRDEEIEKLVAVIAQKADERQRAAADLAGLGVQAPPAKVSVSVTPGALPGAPSETCLTSLVGAPIACW